MDARLSPSSLSFYVGKCQSCRHSIGLDWTDVHIGCTLPGNAEPSMTHRHWSCGQYQYEPGSLE